MAEHVHPQAGESVSSTKKYLASLDHKAAADTAICMLESLPGSEVRDIQFPKDLKYTCWYLSVLGYAKLPIVNLTLQSSGRMNVEFRYMQFVPPHIRDILRWQTGNWPYARLSESAFTESEIARMLAEYIPQCKEALEQGRLKKGGTSAAETVVGDVLDLYGIEIIQGAYPELLRNADGNLLQLDFQLPSLKIAIEVQGPHHFRDFFGKPEQLAIRQKNDAFKVKTCLENDMSIIWMNSEGIQKELVRLPISEQKEIIRELLDLTKHNHPCHVIWEGIKEPPKIIKP